MTHAGVGMHVDQGSWVEGEHTSNPQSGPPDLGGFYGHGGLTAYKGRRFDVDHYNVSRQRFVGDPLAACREEEL